MAPEPDKTSISLEAQLAILEARLAQLEKSCSERLTRLNQLEKGVEDRFARLESFLGKGHEDRMARIESTLERYKVLLLERQASSGGRGPDALPEELHRPYPWNDRDP